MITLTSEAAIGHSPKIATCRYCGVRAMLVLKGDSRHELACNSCGAPLHNMKQMPKASQEGPSVSHKKARKTKPAAAPRPYRPEPERPKRKPDKARRRKSLMSRVLSEAFDVIEDLLD